MTGFEPWNTGIVSDHSANWAATTEESRNKLCPGKGVHSSVGFVCAYHPAISGSNPKHTVNANSIYTDEIASVFVVGMRKRQNKRRDAGIGPFLEEYTCPWKVSVFRACENVVKRSSLVYAYMWGTWSPMRMSAARRWSMTTPSISVWNLHCWAWVVFSGWASISWNKLSRCSNNIFKCTTTSLFIF